MEQPEHTITGIDPGSPDGDKTGIVTIQRLMEAVNHSRAMSMNLEQYMREAIKDMFRKDANRRRHIKPEPKAPERRAQGARKRRRLVIQRMGWRPEWISFKFFGGRVYGWTTLDSNLIRSPDSADAIAYTIAGIKP